MPIKTRRIFRRGVLLLLIFLLSLSAAAATLADTIQTTANAVCIGAPNPTVGSIGGEWAILGLARGGCTTPSDYFSAYYKNIEATVIRCGGVLHTRKYTEYSRVILALTAIGRDPTDVGGYDLLLPLGDFEKTIWQGANGPIWALIALDSGAYAVPQNPAAKVQATRELYLSEILNRQGKDGGWALSANEGADVDLTAMALCALAPYRSDGKVKAAVEAALAWLSEVQEADGGFVAMGESNSESCAQVLTALCALDISVEDARFVKGRNTVLDALLSYATGGGFRHTKSDKTAGQMSTEQALYALVALQRKNEGKLPLYDMRDALGLPGKDPRILKQPIRFEKTFSDIRNSPAKTEIEALAARGILHGKTEDRFDPSATMTRAEFAAIMVKGLGLAESNKQIFTDVKRSDWFFGYVATAYTEGIIRGVSETAFSPNGQITREEAAVMLCRAAKLCGMRCAYSRTDVRDILAKFSDAGRVSDWAKESIAFCSENGILPNEASAIRPQEAVTRAEIAGMLYRMLGGAKLL